ncbi:dolichol kinase-like [Liolophura sinensis]|uniref:dolichol kinase-like n=1 Tax=Liolophura sinensis TaxID=3198878 RepID=UPI0031585887
MLAVVIETSSQDVGASCLSPDLCGVSLATLSGFMLVGSKLFVGKSLMVGLVLAAAHLLVMYSTLCAHVTPLVWFVSLAVIPAVCGGILLVCYSWGRGCFTVGEGMVVSQLFTIILRRVCEKVFLARSLTEKPGISDVWESQALCFASIVFVGLTTILTMLLLYQWLFSQRPDWLVFYVIHIFVAAFIIMPFLCQYLEANPFVWLFQYIAHSLKRTLLLSSWFLLSVTAAVIVCSPQLSPSSSVTRKWFHVLIVAVYVPGLLLDPSFLTLASVIALAVLVVLEAVRVLCIPPLGCTVDSLFKAFCDDKDKGAVIVSHIYLLVGLSLPLWLTYSSPHLLQPHKPNIALYSGVISVGLGDTAASVGGSVFGKHRWPGSKKTIEGTSIAILSQLSFILCLSYFGMGTPESVLSVSVIVISTSVLEGVTSQIDNLILPLFMYTLFMTTRKQIDTSILS